MGWNLTTESEEWPEKEANYDKNVRMICKTTVGAKEPYPQWLNNQSTAVVSVFKSVLRGWTVLQSVQKCTYIGFLWYR